MDNQPTRARLLAALAAAFTGAGLASTGRRASATTKAERFSVTHTDTEWRKLLTPEQYAVLREHSTEAPGSSPLEREHRAGTFACAACDLPLFASKTKFDSGTGWPSFYAPLPHAVAQSNDYDLIVPRVEVHCSRCGGHLGHVFDDGPKPTGLRYCINGVALRFEPASAA